MNKDNKYSAGWEFESLSKVHNYYEWILSKLLQYKPFCGWRSSLDYGAGAGNFYKHIKLYCIYPYAYEPDPQFSSKLLDVVPDVVPKGHFVYSNMEAVRSTAPYNLITAINVLEHIEDDKAELLIMNSLLEYNGHLFLFVPAHPFLYGTLDAEFGHERRYEKKMLRKLVSSCGFRVLKCDYLNPVGAVIWLIMGRILYRTRWNSSLVSFYDKLVIPVARFFDRLPKFFGQSIFLVAVKNTGPTK